MQRLDGERIAVIGGGFGGLSTACYLARARRSPGAASRSSPTNVRGGVRRKPLAGRLDLVDRLAGTDDVVPGGDERGQVPVLGGVV